MRKILFAGMAVLAFLSVAGCKTSQPKREVAQASGSDPYLIPDFNYKLSDIRTAQVTRDQLFKELDPQRIIKNSASVCANRALIWGWNMKRRYNIDSGKIFVFYSRGFFMDPEYRELDHGFPSMDPHKEIERQWWYHVAPYVVEDGKEYVLDHGFTGLAGSTRNQTPDQELTQAWDGKITRPLTINEWLLRFPRTTKCKELTAADTELTDYMRRGASFPHPNEGGPARCYYRKIPMTYWTPLSVAMKELNRTAKGETLYTPFRRENYFESDLLYACEEAVSADGIARYLGRGSAMKACLGYLGLNQPTPGFAQLSPLNPVIDKKLMRRKEKALLEN